MLIKSGRRSFLRKLGGATFAPATMRFLLGTSEGQAFPKRFLFVFTNAGRHWDSRCSGTGPGYTLGVGYEPMQPYKDKILILDGMKIPPHGGEEHPAGKAAVLTARKSTGGSTKATGLSFDRYLAAKLTAGASFFAGTFNGKGSGDSGTANPVSWNGANSPNDAFLSGSTALMNKLFGAGAVLPPAGSPTPTAPSMSDPAAARDRRELALYDYLMADVNRIKNVAPKAEVERLQLHVEALQQLRSGFVKPAGSPTQTGSGPAAPAPAPMVARACGDKVDLGGASAETDKISLVIANAFACDRARIGVVRFGSEEPYHDESHKKDSAIMRRIDKEWAANFANLIGYLDSFKEGQGTVLDNTIVVWSHDCCGEFGVSMDSGPIFPGESNMANGIHNTGYVPFVLSGRLGGTFKTGQRIVALGRTNLELYRTIAQQMGVDASDFGDNTYFRMGLLTDVLA